MAATPSVINWSSRAYNSSVSSILILLSAYMTPVLTLPSWYIILNGRRGLLSLAIGRSFDTFYYLCYTATDGFSVVERLAIQCR